MKKNKVLELILSVVIAVVAWCYIINVVNPDDVKSFTKIPVVLLNQDIMEDSGLAISGTGKYTVDVELTGASNDLSKITADDISATADISGISVGQHFIDVEVICPAEVTVTKVLNPRIQVTIDQLIAEDRPVVLEKRQFSEDYELGELKLSTQKIKVSGAKLLVDNVDHILVTLDCAKLKKGDTIKSEITAIPVDANGTQVGGVKLSTSSVKVTANVCEPKVIALYVPETGSLPANIEIISKEAPATVTIKGLPGNYENTYSLETEPIDLSTITSDCEIPLKVRLYEGIELADESLNPVITYKVRVNGSKEFIYDPAAVVFENLGEGLEAQLQLPVDLRVNVSGELSQVEKITADKFVLSVDVGAFTSGSYGAVLKLSTRGNIGKSVTCTLSNENVIVDLTETLPTAEVEE